jgi:hypothetical protein
MIERREKRKRGETGEREGRGEGSLGLGFR